MQALLAWGLLSTWGWRWLLGASALPLLPLLLAYPWLPESPYWLAATGRHAAASVLLKRIAHVNGGHLPPGRLDGGHPDRATGARVCPTPSTARAQHSTCWQGTQ